jgi:ribosomal protein L11 methylase PrmA
VLGDRVFRTVMPPARDDYEFVRSTRLLERLAERNLVIRAAETSADVLDAAAVGNAIYVLEHPRVPFISYPYEWSFPALKAAALLTLEVHLEALEHGVTLSDASAYNIQFLGPRPLFIDYLSFRRYHNGEFWKGHRQFCEQFLNPLLLTAITGVSYHPWYRGSLEGITAGDLNRLLPIRSKISWRVLSHVVLQAGFSSPSASKDAERISKMTFPLAAFKRMLRSLQSWVAGLEPAKSRATVWENYSKSHTYGDEAVGQKIDFIREFIAVARPELVWDIGCNTGEYAAVALGSGVTTVIGFESDQGALDAAYSRAQSSGLSFLPLYLDAANPSPSEGWNEAERKGLRARASADAILALAFIHHLAIGRNVPLANVIDWLVDLAPSGVIEFVPKDDATVIGMLRLREDIFADYTEEVFLSEIGQRANIMKMERLRGSGRLLLSYRRT